ncbi:tetratricopeptide repeat protein [Paracrocinitomix mangrovi]|uniref:tetratricopeptide repeat protein n=1 Tax=Paracrocinitomix mangrovi TaxID=2862509 RepID=UPI001C8D0424|nr:tetratricopeptide repeat protein [Paracrocinitomix mangrovi]UKN01625.1 tetratricopeptide repeat protein [Paracrocinitomix mangrovi]
MKKIFSYLMFLFISTTAFSFNPPDSTSNIFEKGTAQYLISEGKRLYNEGSYRVALVKFREALVKDKNNPLAIYWVGECHKVLGNYEKAIEYVTQALEKDPEVDDESGFILGQCYQRTAELDKAIENYNKVKSKVKPLRAKELDIDFYIAQCERAKEMMANPVNVTVTNMGMRINSAFDDYAPTLDADGKTIYYVSRRADNKGGGVNDADQRYFEDIYISRWDEENKEWSEPSNSDEVVRRMNTEGFDAVSHISPDGKYLYLTINTMAMEKPKPKTKSSDIFYCKKNTRGGWNSPKSMGKPINTIVFDASASLTADGNTMYFISERKGGQGRADIWVTKLSGKEWSKPVNLGPTINTAGQETTVYVTPDEKYLFFSSDGLDGMGGYDVFVCENKSGQWSDPVNLGYPINTVSDETHFVYDIKTKSGMYSTFSSKENQGVGARDIFKVDMSNYTFKFPDNQ